MFSGSYSPDDVVFLLKPVQIEFTPVGQKETLIQSGQRHYSEMLSREWLPPEEYVELFHAALDRNKPRFARDLIRLGRRIADRRSREITLVSLARAGTPVGALLKRILQKLGRSAHHYSISLIRDRGIDCVALRYLLSKHSPESLVFVDGWTGKGVMARELKSALAIFASSASVHIDPDLYVIADLSGTAAEAATTDDYLIPNSLLGATISGLVSRSLLNADVVGPDDFHGCVFHEEFAAQDLSRWFLDQVSDEIDRQWSTSSALECEVTRELQDQQQQRCRNLMADISMRFGVDNPNHVKPGIGEATRVLLRRVPSHVLLRAGATEDDICHLRNLARQREVPVLCEPGLPYEAVALIRDVSKGDS